MADRLTKVGNYYVRRPQAKPLIHQTWQEVALVLIHDVAYVIGCVLLLLTFFIGIPWLGYLVLGQ